MQTSGARRRQRETISKRGLKRYGASDKDSGSIFIINLGAIYFVRRGRLVNED